MAEELNQIDVYVDGIKAQLNMIQQDAHEKTNRGIPATNHLLGLVEIHQLTHKMALGIIQEVSVFDSEKYGAYVTEVSLNNGNRVYICKECGKTITVFDQHLQTCHQIVL